MTIINNILLIFLFIILIALIKNNYIYENMINPKLFIRHLQISPNEDITRLSTREQKKLHDFRKCQNKTKGFYRCINSIYLPQTIIRNKIKAKKINYSQTGNVRHLFPVDFNP